MPGPTVSVALCTYNGARFLPDQLQSIAAQIRPPDELVVCDDGSTDQTADILRKFARNAPFAVRFEVNEHNLGSTKNFEKAIGLCQGEIIALADQDDVWKSHKISVLQSALEDHPDAGYAYSNADLIDEHGNPIGTMLWDLHRGSPRPGNMSGTQQVVGLLHHASATGATMAFRARLNSVLLPISPCFVHDYWISLVASCLGWYGVGEPEPLIQYRQHREQQLGAFSRSVLKKVAWARRAGLAEYDRNVQGFQDVRQRLLKAHAQGWTYPASNMVLVEEKIRHCSERATARSARGTARVGKVLSELMTGRYARYSNSWQSVVEDLCL